MSLCSLTHSLTHSHSHTHTHTHSHTHSFTCSLHLTHSLSLPYRQKTKLIYTIYSRRSPATIHSILSDLKADYVIVDDAWCRRQYRPDCAFHEMSGWSISVCCVTINRPQNCLIVCATVCEFTLAHFMIIILQVYLKEFPEDQANPLFCEDILFNISSPFKLAFKNKHYTVLKV